MRFKNNARERIIKMANMEPKEMTSRLRAFNVLVKEKLILTELLFLTQRVYKVYFLKSPAILLDIFIYE